MPQPPHLMESWLRTTPPTWKTSWAATWSQSYKLFCRKNPELNLFLPFGSGKFRKVFPGMCIFAFYCICLKTGLFVLSFHFAKAKLVYLSQILRTREICISVPFFGSRDRNFFGSLESSFRRRQKNGGGNFCLVSVCYLYQFFFSAGGDFWPKFWIGRMISRPLLGSIFPFSWCIVT